MTDEGHLNINDQQGYQEREAVALFDDEKSLNAAVDELMQSGFRQEDMGVLAHADRLSTASLTGKSDDAESAAHANYVSPDARTEAMAAITGGPALIAGLGVAAVAASGGIALIPTLAVTIGSSLASGALGLVLARAFGRRHADYVERQILAGGMFLWVHAPDEAKDAKIIDILTRNGARDAHFHIVHRSWGTANVPLHELNPDPLLRD